MSKISLEEGVCLCGAEVYWVKMANSGRPMIVERRRLAIVTIDPQTGQGRLVQGFAPHWATCKYAKDFKKPPEERPKRKEGN